MGLFKGSLLLCMSVLCYARSHFAPISSLSLFATPGSNSQPHYDTDHYTPYPRYHTWSRPMHSLMAIHHLDSRTALWLSACCLPHVHLMSTSWTALWLFTSCLPYVYHMSTSWLPHVYLMAILPTCLSHSLASRRLMYFISTSSPLYHPYPSSCSSHIPLMLSLMYSSWRTLILYGMIHLSRLCSSWFPHVL